jgi:hypothetical protein
VLNLSSQKFTNPNQPHFSFICFRGSPPQQSKAIAYTAARGKNQGDEDFDRRSSLTVCYEAYPVMLLSMGK